MSKEKILIIGAMGQLGTELTENLISMYGEGNVLATDIRKAKDFNGQFQTLDVLDKIDLDETIKKFKPNQVYHLAALLSATAEKKPKFGWKLNMDGLFNVMDAVKDYNIRKMYWPSSIAVFGPSTPRNNTPQNCVMDPNTIYGISKLAGERYCEYYHEKYGVDVRSLRYPGLIGYKSAPGGGTTDYAVSIYHKALATEKFECFLKEDTALPMLYMPDAIKATIDIMHAPAEKVKVRSSYNLGGISFDPKQIAESIKKEIPNFEISYAPDERQAIADSWPASIDDSVAYNDWGWKHKYSLDAMTKDMLKNLRL